MPKPCNLKTAKIQKSESCSAPYELFTADYIAGGKDVAFAHAGAVRRGAAGDPENPAGVSAGHCDLDGAGIRRAVEIRADDLITAADILGGSSNGKTCRTAAVASVVTKVFI
jgi:hypothetical protein